jgi:hemolysin activation/secretion protein
MQAALAVLLLSGSALAGALASADAGVVLTVGHFSVEDGYPELAHDTETILAPLQDHPVPLESIGAAASRLEQAYSRHGYFLTRIDVPPQNVPPGGEMRLRVVHGFIARIDVDGIPAPVRARVLRYVEPLVGRRWLTRRQYERQVLLANSLPNLHLRAALKPGAEDGAVLLVLTGSFREFSSLLSFDNYMPAVLGRSSVTVASGYTPGTSPIEQIYLTATAATDADPFSADSPRRYFETGVRSAFGVSGAEMDLRYVWAMGNPPLSTTGHSDNAFLDTAGTFRRAALVFSYPLLKSSSTQLSIEATFDATAEFQLTNPYAISLYSDHLRVLRLGVHGARSWNGATDLAFGIELAQGLDIFGSRGPADATPTVPLSQSGASNVFTKWSGHASLRHKLPVGFAVGVQVRGQYVASRPVLLAEKFNLGGPADLSAYDLANFSGDRGWTTRGELQHDSSWNAGPRATVVEGYVFAARGEVVNLASSGFERRAGSGNAAGIGLRSSVDPNRAGLGPLELNLEYARAFNPPGSGLPDGGRFSAAVTLRF